MKTSIARLAAFATAAVVTGMPALVFATTATHPGPSEHVYQTVVRYGDLDLSTNQGADHLYVRLDRAAHQVCGDTGDPLFLEARHSYRVCEQKAIEHAVAQLGRPKLTATYDQHFPNQPLARVSEVQPGSDWVLVG